MSVKARGVGRGTRVAILTQVTLTVVLAMTALVLVNWLAARPGFRSRIDLTAADQNTLSTAAIGVLDQLAEPVVIDVFYRGEEGPLLQLGSEVIERTYRLLLLMEKYAGGNVELRSNKISDREAVAQRLVELKLTGFENCLIVSKGQRREVLRLNGDLAQLDPGRPKEAGYRPPSILAFTAEEAIVQGILAVTRGEVLPVYFSTGHGERILPGLDDERDLGLLQATLRDDGFEPESWEFAKDGPVPEDASALAIIGPEVAFTDEELAAVLNYVEAGGRLVLSPANDPKALERSSVPELLDHFGIEIGRGLVGRPFPNATGGRVVGSRDVFTFGVPLQGMANHPITNPLRAGNRSIVFPFSRVVKVKKGGQPRLGTTLPILSSGPDSWHDLNPVDYIPDTQSEPAGPFNVAVVSLFQPPNPRDASALEARPESRIVALGSTDALSNVTHNFNVDFARNVFNWAVSREYRVSISPRDPDRRILRIRDTDALARLTRVSVYGLPGLCLLLGIVTAVRRASGGPKRNAG